MILPIEIYNSPILRKKCNNINFYYPNLEKLISDMFETMHNANGIGLAAPQIGINIRLFIVDVNISLYEKNTSNVRNLKYKEVFINPKIINNYGKNIHFQEGCLSIPTVLEYVLRKSHIIIEYYDNNGIKNIKSFKGIISRIIQHEYDHIEGILFIDLLPSIKKELINNKLIQIKKRIIKINYPIKN